MEFNRNHYFLAGVVVLLLGLQVRLVDSFVLTSDTTRFLAQRFQNARGATFTNIVSTPNSGPRKTVRPPDWLGWAIISVGSVLVLHSLAMPRPGGH
ncbi:MAG TPA: hypothetical protein VGJ26_20425 [Pirellulales bacterium]